MIILSLHLNMSGVMNETVNTVNTQRLQYIVLQNQQSCDTEL